MFYNLIDIEEYHYTISKDLGTVWAGWQEEHLDDVLPFHNFNNKKSCDHVKRLTIEANHLKNLTVSKPNKSQEQTCDRGKRLTIAANHLKNLAGNTQNRNESKINLDS